MDIVRIYTDDQGETHFEDISVDLAEVDFAPPATPFSMTKPIAAQNMTFAEFPDDWYGDWHPTPTRQYAIFLSGIFEVEVSDGEIRRGGAGEFALYEDTGGKGHVSRVLPGTKGRALFIQLAD